MSLEAKLTSVPSNFTKIIKGEVAVGTISAGKEVWSTCDAKAGIKLRLDSRITEPAGQWLWTVNFNYNGQPYTLHDVPMQ